MERLRTRILGLVAFFALLVARLTDGAITLPAPRGYGSTLTTWQPLRSGREQMSGDELLGDQLLRGHIRAHVAAPVDFTARVMSRVAAESIAPEVAPVRLAAYETAPEGSSLLHQAGVVFATLGVSALLVLGFSFVATLVNPSLGLAAMGALVNVVVMALSTLRLAGTAFTDVATNAGLTTAVMTLLLGGVLLVWSQVSRLYARTAEEA